MFYLPAESETYRAVILTWPHKHSDWADNLADIEHFYKQFLDVLSPIKKVIVLCYNEQHIKSLQAKLGHSHSIIFVPCPTNDTWVRDYGPISLISAQKITYLNFQFNGWGNKFAFELDNAVNDNLQKQGILAQPSMDSIDFILEGGSIDSDGNGTLLTTQQCLQSRYPHLTMTTLEQHFKKHLNINRILSITAGALAGDDTDSHVDMLARFASPTKICYTACDDTTHPNYQSLKKMEAELKQFKTAYNTPYELFPLFIPPLTMGKKKQILPLSYANFLIVDQHVFVPTYNAFEDDAAMASLQQAFPKHTLLPVNSLPLIEQGGSIHCATMQLY